MIELKQVDCGYYNTRILSDVSMKINDSGFTCLLGKNGVGKTTLFKTILGLLPVMKGQICYDGKEKTDWSEREFARLISYVPQAHGSPFSYRVLDVVLMGQYVHTSGFFKRPGLKNIRIAKESIEMLGIERLTYRNFAELSGGERQMVLIARALAQQPKYIAMDEPTANLDMGNRIRVLKTASMLKEKGYGIMMNTHSPQQVLQFADSVILLKDGKVTMTGAPSDVLKTETVSDLYNAPVEVVDAQTSAGIKKRVLIFA